CAGRKRPGGRLRSPCKGMESSNVRAPGGGRAATPPRRGRASVRAVVAAVVGPIIAAIAAVVIGRITVAVTVGRVAVTVTVGGVAVTIAVVARIVIGIGGPPQRRADQRADGEAAPSPAPAPPTPASLRRPRRAHGDSAGEQHGDQCSSHSVTSLVISLVSCPHCSYTPVGTVINSHRRRLLDLPPTRCMPAPHP